MASIGSPPNRAGQPADGFYSPREITYVTPLGRRLTEYEVAICHAQPDTGHYETESEYLTYPDGRGRYDPAGTALRHPDWFEYRDPSGLWQRTYVREQATQERSIEGALEAASLNGAYEDIDEFWGRELLAPHYEAVACLEWGLFLGYTRCVREALSDTLTMAFNFAAVDRLRHQQAIALFSLELDQRVLGYQEGLGLDTWLTDPIWQPVRRVVEEAMTLEDWGEFAVLVGLLLDPLISNFLVSRFFRRFAPVNGDTLTPIICMTAERDRARSLAATTGLVRMVLAETDRAGRPVPWSDNRRTIQAWLDHWAPKVTGTIDALAALYELPTIRPDTSESARHYVLTECERLLETLTLELPKGIDRV